MQFLADEFFAAQNARNMDRLLGLFNFHHPVHFNYHDARSGRPPVQIGDGEQLVTYVKSTWAGGDTFSDVRVGPPDVAIATYPDANPGGDFVRRVEGRAEKGTIKMVCADGFFVEIAMQSAP